ncbi:MAG: hypothetical protein KA757_01525 [Vogesella sp.]|nr:hypothetical protein [Vogesella sp.]
MNAAKRIKKLMDAGADPQQLETLKHLALALQLKQPYELHRLYEIDYPFFEIAIQLLQDWRLGHHIDARSKLIERLFGEYPELMLPSEAEQHPELPPEPPVTAEAAPAAEVADKAAAPAKRTRSKKKPASE